MIYSKEDLMRYLSADARANDRDTIKARFFGDEIWKYIVALRKLEYYTNGKDINRPVKLLFKVLYKRKVHQLGMKLGYTIPINVIDKGLALVHRGTIVVAKRAKLGENCRIHEGVTIGATNGQRDAAVIGNNVFIATGAKIIGKVVIADDVAIAANAVVTKSILEPGTTWGGIPAQKISDRSSRENLCNKIFE